MSEPAAGAVHVWRVRLDLPRATLAALELTLSPVERDAVTRRSRAKDARRLLVSRAVLRAVLGSYLGLDPAAIGLDRTCPLCGADHGRPRLVEPASDLTFSLSRSGDRAVVAVHRTAPVGIDIEQVSSRLDTNSILGQLATGEQAALRRLPEGQRLRAFYAVWTRKEAFLKATGEGLMRDLQSFEVSASPNRPRIRWTNLGKREIARWSLVDLMPRDGYVGALATEGPVGAVVERDWRIPV